MSKILRNARKRTAEISGILGFAVALALMFVVAVAAMLQLQRLGGSLDTLGNQLSTEERAANWIVNAVLMTQRDAQRYLGSQAQADADRFLESYKTLVTRTNAARRQIADPNRLAILESVANDVEQYGSTFNQVVDLVQEYHRIRIEVLDIERHETLNILTAIRVDIAFRSDPTLFLAFDNARSATDNFQAQTVQYLEKPSPDKFVQVNLDYQQCEKDLSTLADRLDDDYHRERILLAIEAARAHQQGVQQIHDLLGELDAAIQTMQTELEPAIILQAYEVSNQIATDFQIHHRESRTSLERARWILAFTLAAACAAGAATLMIRAQRNRERDLANAVIRQSEAKYRTLFESLPVGLYRSTPDGRLLDANPAFVEIMGYPDRDTLLNTPAVDFYVDHEDRKNWQAMIEAADIPEAYDAPFRRYDGGITWTHNTGRAVRDSTGKVVYYEGSLEDITTQVNAQSDLKLAQEQLIRQEKLAILGQLAGGVGHDLRNPLGIISNAIYYLKNVLNAGEQTAEYLDIIMGEVHNADHIVADLLNFARTRDPERERIAVALLLQNAVDRVSIDDTIACKLDLADALPDVYVDPQQINQVLVNLITNACQAMPDGGTLTLRTHMSTGNPAFVCIAVQDSGIGISEEHLQRLFEPLFTTKRRGIGLGLVTSRNLAEANGGGIEVQSEVGSGSTFTLCLPTRDHIFQHHDAHPKE